MNPEHLAHLQGLAISAPPSRTGSVSSEMSQRFGASSWRAASSASSLASPSSSRAPSASSLSHASAAAAKQQARAGGGLEHLDLTCLDLESFDPTPPWGRSLSAFGHVVCMCMCMCMCMCGLVCLCVFVCVCVCACVRVRVRVCVRV